MYNWVSRSQAVQDGETEGQGLSLYDWMALDYMGQPSLFNLWA